MNLFRARYNWLRKRFLERQLAKIAVLFQKGVAGDSEAVKAAYELLTRLRQLFPEDHLLAAYYGSTLTLLGRDAMDPLERLEYVRQGLKVLDEAVTNDGDNVMIRTLRGYVCYRLPEVFFHRTATSVTDFSYLIARHEQNPELFSAEFYQQVKEDLAAAKKTLERIEKCREQVKREGV
ncbi:MAG TPA: hypothetical protein VIM29_03505 [Bacillota bacterium]